MKRILSFILLVCMIISLVPTFSASAEGEVAYQLVYHLTQVDEFRNATPYCNKVDSSNYMIPKNVTFAGTYGMWEFYAQNGIDGWDTNQAFQYRKNYSEIKTKGTGTYFAVKVNVPYTADYTADLRYYQYKGSGNTNANVYLVSGNTANVAAPTEQEKIADIANDVPFVVSTGSADYKNADAVNIPLSAGEYILVFYVTTPATSSSSANRIRPVSLTLTSGSGESYATVPAYINKANVAKTTLEIDEITSYEFSGWMNDYSAFDEASANITVASKNGCVSINASAKSITAVKSGKDIITFSVSNGGKVLSREVELTVKSDENEAITNAFNATETPATGYVESTVTGLTTDSTIEAVKNSDGTFALTAPETKGDAKFLYWAKGMSKNKKIVAFSNELSNYMPEENGKNYLIAVYEGDVTDKDEYYNANGQLLPDATENDRPYMAGYGKAIGWNRYGETKIHVAQYDKTEPGVVTVTVEDGSGSATVPYGEAVTCTADESNGTFLWWQKDVNGEVEIVSLDKSYTFLAYKNCTVTAVYGDEAVSVAKPAKIILDIFGENSVMAEFIGFGNNVVEKGIMLDDRKIAMTSPGDQFTITADKSGTYKGYAVIKDAGGYTLVTDGETEVTISK